MLGVGDEDDGWQNFGDLQEGDGWPNSEGEVPKAWRICQRSVTTSEANKTFEYVLKY